MGYYVDHQPEIARFARANPGNLAKVYQFVTVSARIRFHDVPGTMRSIENGNTTLLWAWKREAWEHARDNAETIYRQCEEIADLSANRRERGELLVSYLATLPGLNLAKGGFMAQLAYGCGGCLDTVNIRRLGLTKSLRNGNSRYRIKAQRTPGQRLRLARWYVATCESLGGPGRLWDDWCDVIAETYPEYFPSGHTASAWHLSCLGLT
jgi:hypothetical protein